MANQVDSAIKITQVGPTTWTIRGYTKPYTETLRQAGATWDAKAIAWRYEGRALPAAINALLSGLTNLEVPASAPVLIGGDGVTLALKQTVTVGDNPIVGLVVDLDIKAGKVCITRPNPKATTNMTHWVAANKVRQADSPIGEKPTPDTDVTKWGKAVRAQEQRAREAIETAKNDPAKVDAALDEIVKAVEIGQSRPQMEAPCLTAREVMRTVLAYVKALPYVEKKSLCEGDLLIEMTQDGSLWQMAGWDGDTPLLRPRLVKTGSREPRPKVLFWNVNWRRLTTSEAAWIARLRRAYRDMTKSSPQKPPEPARIVYAAYESEEFPDYEWGSAPRQVDVIDEALYPRYRIGEKVFARPGNHPAIVREVLGDDRYEVFDGFGRTMLHADWLYKHILFPPTGEDRWTQRATPALRDKVQPAPMWWIDEDDTVFRDDDPAPDAFAVCRGPYASEAEARAMLKPKRSSSAFQLPSDVTPLRQQYLDIKAQYPGCILFFRLGDFYELFDEDAKLAAKELDLVLTSRPVNRKQRVLMAGVPHHALEQYVAKLIEKSYHVAVCEQISEPNGGGLVKRRVERVKTPGKAVLAHE